MPIRKLAKRFTGTVEEQDRQKLAKFCAELGVLPISQVEPRVPVRVAGEIQTVMIVPRAGSPSLEVTVGDGEAQLVGVFFGRRKILGLTPGRRLILAGVASSEGTRTYIYTTAFSFANPHANTNSHSETNSYATPDKRAGCHRIWPGK